jgi:hypothetical protein
MNLTPFKANMNEVTLNDNVTVLFSYKTPVAIMIDEGLGYVFYRTSKRWSNTTTRHINQWLGVYGKVASERPQAYFDNLIKSDNLTKEK